ncbi:MAG TPA: 2-phosphosulfolactate phosphatase [Candidatus Acidoferrales bacterium]|nr:2-phosphosulfolactate phosphatase [Candidatus Acidoferrales bacterium]
MRGIVAIDCFPESVQRYPEYAVVGIDVIRATTTAVTSVAAGRRCFPAASLEEAVALAKKLKNPLVVGELGGNMPFGFDMTNSPAQLALRRDTERPMILLSSSGTQVIAESAKCMAGYVACLRNTTAQVAHLADRHEKVALVGAGSRGEFREEDQLCCAWIAEGLIRSGYQPANEQTERIVERWSGAKPESILISKSVEYLRRTEQMRDLDFILSHVDDLAASFEFRDGEVVIVRVPVDEENERESPVRAGIRRPTGR